MQAVGQLDDHDAHVLLHEREHFAQRLDLLVHVRLAHQVHAFEFRDAVDEHAHGPAEFAFDVGQRDRRVFHRVVQEAGDDRVAVGPEASQNAGDRDGMREIGLPGLAALERVGAFTHVERLAHRFAVAVGQMPHV